jgi:mutator protein MutT
MDYIEQLRQRVGTMPLILNSSGIIIKNNAGEILLAYRNDTKNWGIPGGYMEPGETFEDTIKRELVEELNIKVERLSLYKVFSGKEFYHEYPNGDKVYSVIAMFECKNIVGEPSVDQEEIRKVQYFPMNALPEKLTKVSEVILGDYGAKK